VITALCLLLRCLQPHLPSADTVSGLGVLRLWAGNEHGFAMAPVRLPQQLLAGAGAAGAGSSAAASAPAAPWIANLYVKVSYAWVVAALEQGSVASMRVVCFFCVYYCWQTVVCTQLPAPG
jgi:hypothetical protein